MTSFVMCDTIFFMKKLTSIIINLLFCAFIFATSPKSVDIIFEHDVHSFLDQMSKAKTLIDEQKEKSPNTFVFDAGDFSMGTLYQTVFETQASELRLLGKMGVDASTLGNHEFDFGADGLANMLEVAFSKDEVLPQMVLCNIDYSIENEYTNVIFPTLKKYFKDYTVIQKGDVKIAVIGVFGLDAFFCSPTCEITFINPVQAVKNTVAKIKQNENVDMIVCLSHGGTNKKSKKSEDEILAKNVPELDLIVSGHSHTFLEKPIICENTTIVSCGSNCRKLGKINFVQNDDKRWNVNDYELIQVDDKIAENEEINQILKEYSNSIDNEYLAQFGFTKEEVLTNSTYDLQVNDEVGYAMSNAVLKTVNEVAIETDGNKIDIAVIPAGTLRDTYKTGEVTVDDVFTSFSLGIGPDKITGYPLVSLYVTGKELKSVAELDCSLSPLIKYVRIYSDQVSYDFNPKRVILDRVTKVYLFDENRNRVPIDLDRLYKVTCDLYTANMLGGILATTKGLVSIVPKDKNGNIIENFEEHIMYMKGDDGKKVELKGWYAIAHSLAKNDQLGDWSDSRKNAAISVPSLNPLKFFAQPSKIAIILYSVVLVLIVILVGVVILVSKKRSKK